jgi:hypothetical protein
MITFFSFNDAHEIMTSKKTEYPLGGSVSALSGNFPEEKSPPFL